MTDKITASQRSLIDLLLRKAEFPTDYVCLLYRRLGVSDEWQGRRVFHWVDSLSMTEASDCITMLKRIVE